MRIEIKHLPSPAAITDGCAVMHLTGVDGDDVARFCFDHAPAAERDLRSPADQSDPELIVHMSAESERRVGLNGVHSVHYGGLDPE